MPSMIPARSTVMASESSSASASDSTPSPQWQLLYLRRGPNTSAKKVGGSS